MRRTIYDYFFLFLLVAVLYGMARLFSPFIGALLVAFICAIVFRPMYRKLRRLFPKLNPSVQSALADGLVLIFFVAPLLVLITAMFYESASFMPTLKEGSATMAQIRGGHILQSLPWMEHVRYFLMKAFGVGRAQFQAVVIKIVNKGVDYVSLGGSRLAAHMLALVANLLIMVFSLFFMFRDGPKWVIYIKELLPMRREKSDELIDRVHFIVMGLVRGMFLTSLIQGILATIGYFIVGADGAVVLGVLTAFSGLIPVVGTFGVWGPAALYLILQGSYVKGTILLVWGAVVVSGVIDTFVRPYLVGKNAHLSSFILFFAFLGGIEVWGVKGIILGPMVVAIAPVVFDMYRQRFSRQPEITPSLLSTLPEVSQKHLPAKVHAGSHAL